MMKRKSSVIWRIATVLMALTVLTTSLAFGGAQAKYAEKKIGGGDIKVFSFLAITSDGTHTGIPSGKWGVFARGERGGNGNGAGSAEPGKLMVVYTLPAGGYFHIMNIAGGTSRQGGAGSKGGDAKLILVNQTTKPTSGTTNVVMVAAGSGGNGGSTGQTPKGGTGGASGGTDDTTIQNGGGTFNGGVGSGADGNGNNGNAGRVASGTQGGTTNAPFGSTNGTGGSYMQGANDGFASFTAGGGGGGLYGGSSGGHPLVGAGAGGGGGSSYSTGGSVGGKVSVPATYEQAATNYFRDLVNGSVSSDLSVVLVWLGP